MSDTAEKCIQCADRLKDSKFPDYHAEKWLRRAAIEIELLERRNKQYSDCLPLLYRIRNHMERRDDRSATDS